MSQPAMELALIRAVIPGLTHPHILQTFKHVQFKA